MKCPNCKESEMIYTYESFKFDSKSYTNLICNNCDHEEFIEVIPAPRKKKSKADMIALCVSCIGVVSIVMYVLSNIDKFSTIYK